MRKQAVLYHWRVFREVWGNKGIEKMPEYYLNLFGLNLLK